MDRARTSLSKNIRRRRRQGGFNFAEVLFAVMILGIGFIMIAAIFPVALVQSKLTQEETSGQSIARGAANYLEQIATDATMPATGITARGPKLTGTIRVGSEVRAMDAFPIVRGGMITSADSRLGWIPFYRREGTRAAAAQADWSPFVQVYMIPVAVRNRATYEKAGIPLVVQGTRTADPVTGPAVTNIATLNATIVDSTAAGNTEAVDYIEFPVGSGENDIKDNYTAVADGSYVIIAGAPAAAAADLVSDPTGAHARVGHIFRIGAPTETQPVVSAHPRRWSLTPGYDYVPKAVDTDENGTTDITPTTLTNLSVFVVGRGLLDSSVGWSATNPRDGTGQEVGAFTTFIQIR